MVFDRDWFHRHQSKLLWLLNTPIIRTWFRWVMCIDCKKHIHRIEPNAISFDAKVRKEELKQTTEFRTHNKYAKRLYYAFYPLWWLMHQWDMAFAQERHELNFGFDTLTAYPDAHSESTTFDAWVKGGNSSSGVSWATLRGLGSSDKESDTAAVSSLAAAVGGTTTNMWEHIYRGIFLFDLSSISGADISAATISFRGHSKGSSGNPDLDVVSTNPSSNTVVSRFDYGTFGSTVYGSVSYTSFSTSSGYNDISLNAAGITQCNPGGIAKFGTLLSYDTDNIAPIWASGLTEVFNGYFADSAGTTSDPKLTVTYSTAIPIQVNISDVWKDGAAMQVNIGDDWKDVTEVKINVGDTWEDVF